MMAARTVIIAVTGAREGEIAAAVNMRRELTVVRRCAELAEAVAAAQAGVGEVLVVSDQPHLTRDIVAQLRAAGVVVVACPSTPEAGEQLRAMGIEHVVAAGAPSDDAASAVIEATALVLPRLLTDHDPPSAPARSGKIVAVWGPTGAPGRTTLATSLAVELALAGRRTLVVDVDTYGASVAAACGLLDEAASLVGVVRTAQRGSVDRAVIDHFAQEVREGLRVLAGVSRAARWPELPGPVLDAVWPACRESTDVTVVDCGFALEHDELLAFDSHAPQRNGATRSALAHADVVVAVGSAEPVGMQRLIHSLDELNELSQAPRVVVVNKVRAEVAGPRPEQAVADALTRYASVSHTWTVPWDPKACDAATLAGRLLPEVAPRSRVRKAIAGLATSLTQILDADSPVAGRVHTDPTVSLSH